MEEERGLLYCTTIALPWDVCSALLPPVIQPSIMIKLPQILPCMPDPSIQCLPIQYGLDTQPTRLCKKTIILP